MSYEELLKEYKNFREQIYAEISRLDTILRALKVEDLVAEIVEEVASNE